MLRVIRVTAGKQDEARRRRETTDAKEDPAVTKKKIIKVVQQAVQTRLVSFVLSLLPREISAGLSTASFLGGIVPLLGAAAGFAIGGSLENVRRRQESIKERQTARIENQRRGGIAQGNTFVPPASIEEIVTEGHNLKEELTAAITSGSGERIEKILIKLFAQNSAKRFSVYGRRTF